MERQQLITTLGQLHEELDRAERVDPETLARLRALTADLERIVDESRESTPEEVEPVSTGLNDLILKFEAEHPQLATSIGRVADALAAMGI